MSNRYYIDVNTTVGKRTNIISENIPYTIKDFLKDQKYYGIDASLASMSYASDYSIFVANKEIIDISKKNERILPIISLYPGFQNEIKDFNNYLLNLYMNGAKGISLSLKNMFIFSKERIIPIFKFAQDYNLPILINFSDIEHNLEIFNLIKQFPGLKVIIGNINFAYVKYIVDYMKDNDNLYISISNCLLQNLIEYLVNEVGDERILFGSGYPLANIGSSKAMLEYASISENSKNKISHLNAIRLFNIDKNIKKNEQHGLDRIASAIDNGQSLNEVIKVPIIDAHTHINGDESIATGWYGSQKSFDDLYESSRRLGISKVFTSSLDGLTFTGSIGNKVIRNGISREKNFMYGYAYANPYYKEDINDCLKRLNDSKFIGLKLYPGTNRYPYDGKLYKEVLDKTNENRKIFLLHGSPDDAKRILEKYKGLKVILAHTTQSYEFMNEAIEVLKKYDNLYLDVCSRYNVMNPIKYLVDNGLEDKIVFGSDAALLSQAAHLGLVGYERIPESTKVKILTKNVIDLLNKR